MPIIQILDEEGGFHKAILPNGIEIGIQNGLTAWATKWSPEMLEFIEEHGEPACVGKSFHYNIDF